MFALPITLHQCSTGHAIPSNETTKVHAPRAYFATVGPTSIFDGLSGTNINSAMLDPGYWSPSSVKASCTRDCKARRTMEKISNAEDNTKMTMVCGAIGRLRRCIVLEQLLTSSRWLGACFKSFEQLARGEDCKDSKPEGCYGAAALRRGDCLH